MTRRTANISLLLFFLISAALWGENLRGNVTAMLDLSQESQTSRDFNLKVNELLGIFPGGKSDFLQGLDISVKIPSPLLQSGTSFLLIIYKSVTPELKPGLANYRAQEAGHLILPSRSRIYIELPLDSLETPRSGTVSALTLDGAVGLEDMPLLMTILPMSKGAPESLDTSSFQVGITPVWGDIGKVEISLAGDPFDQSTLMIWIDDEKIGFSGQTLILPTGVHKILAKAEGCRDISRSFAVQKAQVLNLVLPFEHLRSTVLFEAPQDTQIFLDGEKISFPQNGPLPLSDGDHTALFMLGDYRISKHFRIAPGKDYKISLFLDILLQEY